MESIILCCSKKKSYPPQGRSLEIPRGGGGRGVSKAKNFKGKYEPKLEFRERLGGGVFKPKTLCGWGRVCLFSETKQ